MPLNVKHVYSGRAIFSSYSVGDAILAQSLDCDDLVWLQASGSELVYVVGAMSNIPLSYVTERGNKYLAPTQTWFGDHARFIYRNLSW